MLIHGKTVITEVFKTMNMKILNEDLKDVDEMVYFNNFLRQNHNAIHILDKKCNLKICRLCLMFKKVNKTN